MKAAIKNKNNLNEKRLLEITIYLFNFLVNMPTKVKLF